MNKYEDYPNHLSTINEGFYFVAFKNQDNLPKTCTSIKVVGISRRIMDSEVVTLPWSRATVNHVTTRESTETLRRRPSQEERR